MINVQSASLSHLIEIALITYNRASFLDNTLSQLAESPFRNVRITIFDNCSTDATQDVCRKYAEVFLSLTVIRHKNNIGRYANYLRAVETLSAEYGWILCDDDNLDLSSVSQLIPAIESEAYDILYIGSRKDLLWDGVESCSMSQLVAAKARVYATFSSWPVLIFRTSLFSEECIVKGYRLIKNINPNFPFINSLVERNAGIYVSTQQLVIRTERISSDYTDLFWYSAWVNCCQAINNSYLRERTIDEVTAKCGFLKTLTFWIPFDRKCDSHYFWNKIVDIIWGLSLRQRLKFLLLLPLIFISIPQSWLKRQK